MFIVLIFAILGIVGGIVIAYNDKWSTFFEYVQYSISGAFYLGVVGIIVAALLPMDTCQEEYYWEIENLQDNSSVEGNFFLGCGQVDGTMKYTFYIQEGDFYRMKQLNYDQVRIQYTEGSPKVHITERSLTDHWSNNFSIDHNIGEKWYVIEVPKGTIQQNYNLDAK